MDVSLESALNRPDALPSQAARPLEEWNAAYIRVESYFHALQIRNRVLLGRRVNEVLQLAMLRAPQEPERSATELATEEMNVVLREWFASVLQEPPQAADAMVSTRGRLALLIADISGKWQDQFLHTGPWSQEFVTAMREAYLRAGPEFQLSQMTPRPLELGPIAILADPNRLPFRLMMVVWIIGAVLLVMLFITTHFPHR